MNNMINNKNTINNNKLNNIIDNNKLNNNNVIKCKYCGSINCCCKYGFYINDNKERIQKYKCKHCNKIFSNKEDTRYKLEKYDLNKRKLAITMYINNVGIRSIERILNIPNTLVLNWIKNIGKNIENIINNNKNNIDNNRDNKKINILEMDELYTYVKKNKIKSKYGLLLIEMETGETKTVMLNLN